MSVAVAHSQHFRLAPDRRHASRPRSVSRWAITGCEQSQQTAQLFDHLVGAGQHARRQLKAERLCGLEVDHELELGGLLYRQVGGLLALEDAIDVPCNAPEVVDDVRAIGGQPSGSSK